MEPALLGLILDSNVLIAAERSNLRIAQVISDVRLRVGELPILVSSLTLAEVAHGVYRSNNDAQRRQRRQFVDELRAQVPVHPVTENTAEIIAQIGGTQAAQGINLPLADLIIGACALELG